MRKLYPFRLLVLALILSCGDSEIVNANYVPPNPTYCTASSGCPVGKVCEENVCVTPYVPPSPADATTDSPAPLPPGQCNDDTPCLSNYVCIDGFCQPPNVSDTSEPDTSSVPDTNVTEDTAPPPEDTGPPPEDECNIAGQFSACEGMDTCRVDDSNGSLICSSTIPAPNPKNAPCGSHKDCDIPWGCHFKLCLEYCQLQFGNADCVDGETCTQMLNPAWGVCVPPSS